MSAEDSSPAIKVDLPADATPEQSPTTNNDDFLSAFGGLNVNVFNDGAKGQKPSDSSRRNNRLNSLGEQVGSHIDALIGIQVALETLVSRAKGSSIERSLHIAKTINEVWDRDAVQELLQSYRDTAADDDSEDGDGEGDDGSDHTICVDDKATRLPGTECPPTVDVRREALHKLDVLVQSSQNLLDSMEDAPQEEEEHANDFFFCVEMDTETLKSVREAIESSTRDTLSLEGFRSKRDGCVLSEGDFAEGGRPSTHKRSKSFA